LDSLGSSGKQRSSGVLGFLERNNFSEFLDN
jgi:hypothetical protein